VDDQLDTAPVRWAEEQLGSPVVDVRRLSGGITATMLVLTTASGDRAVLRLMTNEPWRAHGAAMTTRERETQLMLADTGVPAPRSIALDPEGTRTGDAAHLMTLLPGAMDEQRHDDDYLQELAVTLAAIHALRPARRPRDYQSWAVPAKRLVPDWATDPAAWRRAFAVVDQEPPAYEGTFLHRDFQPRNVLWSEGRLSGVVDWVETSWGPAGLDVAHCRTHLAFTHGTAVADRFAEAYVEATARREPAPYWDVLDLVGWLPSPNRVAIVSGPDQQARLEEHLTTVLARM
jgi:aminoglycoside phosphotransferase (APT) family kinase protein